MCLNLWSVCLFESRQTRHTGWWWSRQKRLNFSECRLQRFSRPAATLWTVSSTMDSHRFFNARLRGGLQHESILLQTGHSCGLFLHHSCRHALHKLWLHDKITGCLKMSRQTGQVSSSTEKDDVDNICSPSEAKNAPGTQLKRQSVGPSCGKFSESFNLVLVPM